MKYILIPVLLFFCSCNKIKPEQAEDYLGKNVTVCGVVKEVYYGDDLDGQPTFINFGKPYPDHVFTAVIWGKDLIKIKTNIRAMEGKAICIKGRITNYHGKPQIEITDNSQIQK